MQKSLIFTLLFSIVIAVFAILNASPIPVNLIFSKLEISAALVILISAAFGALIIYSLDVVSRFKSRKEIKALEKELLEVQISYNYLKGQYEDLLSAVQEQPVQTGQHDLKLNQETTESDKTDLHGTVQL